MHDIKLKINYTNCSTISMKIENRHRKKCFVSVDRPINNWPEYQINFELNHSLYCISIFSKLVDEFIAVVSLRP